MDEVYSSPVRDLNHGLAKLTAGEAMLQMEYCSDGSLEVKASLQSLLIEDIRPDPGIVIKRWVKCDEVEIWKVFEAGQSNTEFWN